MFSWAVYLLVMHFIDIYWIIMPTAEMSAGGVMGVLTSVLMTLGMIGLYLGGVLWFTRANQVRVIAVRDPRLPESLAFETFNGIVLWLCPNSLRPGRWSRDSQAELGW